MLTSPNDNESHDYVDNFFVGTVVDNDDPLRLQRVRAVIKGLYEGQTSDLPWIAPVVGRGFGNAGGAGVVAIPLVNSKVCVKLQGGNAHYPVYLGGIVHAEASVSGGSSNYPHRYTMVDRAGNSFTVDPIPGSNVMKIQHASGTQITVNNDGSVSIVAVGDITSQAPQWTHSGPVEINGDVVINGDTDVVGTIAATIDVTATPLSISLATHRHAGVSPGGSQTSPPVP